MMNIRGKRLKTLLSATAMVAVGAFGATPVLAQACPGEEEREPSKTLNTRVATVLQEVFEQMQAEQYQQALGGLNQLINDRGSSFDPFDRATVYELRGSVYANLENFGAALRDFQTALDTGALPQARNNQLRYFIAQLNFQEENYQAAIAGLRDWIQFAQNCGQPVDPSAFYLLAAAYTQVSPPQWGAAESPAESALEGTPEPKKNYYDLANLVYSELNRTQKRTALLERMINIWPEEKSYWTQLSGLYSTSGQDRDAFSVIEVAYRAGLLDQESELLTLIQYYSFFENPYRGAEMLEREMSAGNIERDQDNLVLLSQLWSQAREHKRSIPILREAAGRASNGELYYRLGQVLLADEQYQAAEQALANAVNRGGMDRRDTGDAWMLLGTARFNQAGPEDTQIWQNARAAFVNAQRYETARRQATEWISYIDAVIKTYRDGKAIEAQQKRQRCEADLKRIEQQKRIRDLQNQQPTEEDLAFERQVRAECGADGERAAEAEEAAIDRAEAAEGEAGASEDEAGEQDEAVGGDENN